MDSVAIEVHLGKHKEFSTASFVPHVGRKGVCHGENSGHRRRTSHAEIDAATLEGLGYWVTVAISPMAISPQEALDVFPADPERFGLLLTDQTMPGMTGAALAREATKIRPGFPVILCTGYSAVLLTMQKPMPWGSGRC